MSSTDRFTISRFEPFNVPVQSASMAVLARFSVNYGWLVVNGLALAVLPDRLRVLMPQADAPFRVRIRDKAAYKSLVDLAAETYEFATGIDPETVEIIAAMPLATALERDN